MTDEQKKVYEELEKKYNFGDMSVDIKQARFLAMTMGIAYNLSVAQIDKYLRIQSDDFTRIDLERICVMLDISRAQVGGKDLSLDRVRSYIHGDVEEEESKEPYSKVKRVILSENRFSPSQLEQIVTATEKEIPEEYILKFAKPDIGALQMEKAIRLYEIQKEKEKAARKRKKTLFFG